MRQEWRSYDGTPCWGEQYKSAQQVKRLTDEQIKTIRITGVGLTKDSKHVVCWYVMDSNDALYIVSDYPAKAVARMVDTGKKMDIMEAAKSRRPYAVGYVIPGPIIVSGRVVSEAGTVDVPESMIGCTFCDGTGYVHNPDR